MNDRPIDRPTENDILAVLDAALPGADDLLLCPSCGDPYTRTASDALVCRDCLTQLDDLLATVAQEVGLLTERWIAERDRRDQLLDAIRRRSEPLWLAASILGEPDLAMVPETVRTAEAAAAHNGSLLRLGLCRQESGEARLRCVRALRLLDQMLTAPVIGSTTPGSTVTP